MLVDRHEDCLDVVITPPLTTRPVPHFSECFDPRRIGLLIVVFQGHYHRRPPRTLPFIGLGCSSLSWSRAAQSSSILLSILSKRTSAEAVGMPALCSWWISPRCR